VMSTESCLFAADDVPSTGRSRTHRILAATEPSVLLPALVRRDKDPVGMPLGRVERELRQVIERFGGLTVDVETTGYPVGHPHYQLRTVQLGDDEVAVVFDAADPRQARCVSELLSAAPRLYAHSATADLVPLACAGLIDYESGWERMHDTVIPAKLANPASTGSDPGLKQLAETILGSEAVTTKAEAARAVLFTKGGWLSDTKSTTPVMKSGWAQVDPSWRTMVRYAAADVLDTARLARRLPKTSPDLLERERTVQRMTARIAYIGLPLDGDRVGALLVKHTAAQAEVAARARAHHIDNPGSDQQVGASLLAADAKLPPTETGRPSVSVGTLTPLRYRPGLIGELVSTVLDYRHHDTVITTFLEPYQTLVTHGDGRVRPTVYTLGTGTGRMSCVRPNLQQLPRSGGVRACITADPGCVLISADFSGIELRVAAALSGDTNLRRMILDEIDLHWEIARQMFGSDATKADRYAVKRGVFGRIYGGGIPTLAAQIGCDETVAEAMVNTLDAMTPMLAEWSARLRNQVKSGQTRFTTYTGAVVHLPRNYPHKAPNYVIQRTARELLVDALLRWRSTRWGGCVLLPVHDEVLAMVPEQDGSAATAALVDCMQTDFLGVPIVVEADEPSHAWADAA
jgi:DNA polymerase I-like protein with 3'-5' exonuclease and polymerase domains